MSIESLHMVLWAMKRLERLTSSYDYKTEVLLSCMTLDLENLHSSVKHRQGTKTCICMIYYHFCVTLIIGDNIDGRGILM